MGPLPAAPGTSRSQFQSDDGVQAFLERERRQKEKDASGKEEKLERAEWMLKPRKCSSRILSLSSVMRRPQRSSSCVSVSLSTLQLRNQISCLVSPAHLDCVVPFTDLHVLHQLGPVALDPTKLRSRGFNSSADAARKKAAAKDQSLWTETPAERAQRLADEQSGKKRRIENAEDLSTPEEREALRRKQKKDRAIAKELEEYNVRARLPMLSQ